jgi:nitrite reductase (NO-forming)
MYGLLLVEPRGGLPKVDREYFLVQGEFYTNGAYGARGPQEFAMDKALREQPEYVVFNGHVGSLMGEKALKVNTGESVRLYLGNAGPSLISSFHIVGEIFDSVYGEGGTQISQRNVQTTLVPVGGSAMVDLVAEVPGGYQLVDHSMFRAFNKGAMGMMQVEGAERPGLFSGRMTQSVYSPGTHLQHIAAAIPSAPAGAANNESRVQVEPVSAHGQKVYSTICVACHQPDARGLPGIFPPLAGSDFLMADKDRAIRVLLQGLQGAITVNAARFDGVMPQLPLRDEEIADVLTYVRGSFGNNGSPVQVADIARVRASLRNDLSAPADRVATDSR